jgi:hypothetical protein
MVAEFGERFCSEFASYVLFWPLSFLASFFSTWATCSSSFSTPCGRFRGVGMRVRHVPAHVRM